MIGRSLGAPVVLVHANCNARREYFGSPDAEKRKRVGMGAVPHLSKSHYTSFVDCPRLGYLRCFPARFKEFQASSLDQVTRMETGIRVGEMARLYFPGGALIDVLPTDLEHALRLTQEALEAGADVLYEATFEHDQILVRADILCRLPDGTWELTEVKSGTDVTKPDKRRAYVADVGIQLHVLEACGLPVSRVSLMHLDKTYVHPGGESHKLSTLFGQDDFTEEARAHAEFELPANLRAIRTLLAEPEPPYLLVKNSCRSGCEYGRLYCLPRAPLFPVTEFGRARKALDLFAQAGIEDARNVSTASCLAGYRALCTAGRGDRYLRQLKAIQEGCLKVDPRLGAALEEIRYPVHFFDFEAWAPALPVLAGTSPYQQIPFQWSDHCIWRDGRLDHDAFLADDAADPRRPLAESLLARLEGEGSIVVYHAAFERGCLKGLAAEFPDLAAALEAIIGRLVDLEPIVTDHVYHPDFHGSFSLKRVLPALVPGNGYQDLAIQEGTAAALAYEHLRLLPEGPEKQSLREDMLAYCGQDTQAMVDILWVLQELAGTR